MGVGFYKFPSTNTAESAIQRQKWIVALKRVDDTSEHVHPHDRGSSTATGMTPTTWQLGKWALVCGRHFMTGEFNGLDYFPSVTDLHVTMFIRTVRSKSTYKPN